MIRVSILIPVYNASAYLEETINSAASINWPNKEIIIVDDGSTDSSFEIASRYKSNKIKVYQISNSGAAAARNFAFEMSSGDYIQYLDADDKLHPDKIKIQLNGFSSDEKSLLCCNWKGLDNIEPVISEGDTSKLNPIDFLLNMWNNGIMYQTSCWLTHRDVIAKSRGWDTTLQKNPNDDGEFFCRIILSVNSISFNQSELVLYRKPINIGSSLSQNSSKVAKDSILKSYISYEKNILPISDTLEVRKALAKNYANFEYGYYNLFPDLAAQALSRIELLNLEREKRSVKTAFGILERLIGFRTTMRLRKILRGV